MNDTSESSGQDFIRQIVRSYLQDAGTDAKVVTRFPPEPNGFLHIGHAKSICLNFGIAEEFGGPCYLRFDDTNPLKEDQSYVDAIIEDVRWLGFDWGGRLTYASDYYPVFYDSALKLIRDGNAYVESLSADEIRAYRGTLTESGRNSPHRDRGIEENIDLFERMKAGEFEEGEHALRAKIDMASPNLNMRDPTLYRIRKAHHQRTGDDWCIYPMYDFAHPISDALENITHSLCTLEFEDHRPLYDWVIEHLDLPGKPRQIEFSRLNLAYTVTSKRKLAALIEDGHVEGWDDPRMPTIAGLRRRGYTPQSVHDFCARIGITKKENIIQMGVLENSVREDLDSKAPRVMAVLRPLKLTLTNWPEGKTEVLVAQNHPNKPEMGERNITFGRELYIERDDFMEDPPKKFFRLRPGGEVRLRYGYIIKCEEVIKDSEGNVTELLCTYDPDTRSGTTSAQRKVKGTIHWVSAADSIGAEVRLYDRLFTAPAPDQDNYGNKLNELLNKESLLCLEECRVEPGLAQRSGEAVQFERTGYFVTDSKDSTPERLVFNRVVTLRDSWAKIEKAQVPPG
ncbi:MAG: glutamine--tRNA ligase/YqeY domain fusion protein [Gammaproteobacteria bacterium]|jgi:glutaminyl-tRNA synthetase|nr:glutamine--tRNA ligase/YqeY domain fusion protein [Gammaproteobacteria bacterium]MDP6616600.1 glutamine--tRNA ligase/YqeY domain fusion protein [Gammaproteobacteria bacterium]MDP6694797.1 glutamine--tRNA ligase/YqeY domain fusion protein [Gammaproteobacteria bacterium]